MTDPPRLDTLIRMPSRSPLPAFTTPFDSIEISPIEYDSAQLLLGTCNFSEEREDDVRSIYLSPTVSIPRLSRYYADFDEGRASVMDVPLFTSAGIWR
jgi:hypothetical protein